MLYIVTFETQSFNKELIDKIHSYKTWAMLTPKSFLIESEDTSENICNTLKVLMSNGDRLFVGILSTSAAWVGMPQEVTEWIKKNFK